MSTLNLHICQNDHDFIFLRLLQGTLIVQIWEQLETHTCTCKCTEKEALKTGTCSRPVFFHTFSISLMKAEKESPLCREKTTYLYINFTMEEKLGGGCDRLSNTNQ